MIGNDVVDLDDPETRPETFRPRFDERVFDPVERRAIAHDPHPHARRWAHWAAKEAAYKLARQLDPRFIFSPGRLVARFGDVDPSLGGSPTRVGQLALPEALLAGDAGRLELRWTEYDGAVHVIARPGGSDWGAVTASLERIDDEAAASQRVRTLARQRVARDLGIDVDRIRIEAQGRVPILLIDEESRVGALSLSHHGRFVACAIAIDADATVAEEAAGTGASALRSREIG